MDKKESQGKNNSKGILSGIRVLDLTRMLSGPYCSMMLADNGAEVIKIEDEKGDSSRGNGPYRKNDSEKKWAGYFVSLNRNKKSICLNLKVKKDNQSFLNLVKTADILIENFRPGVMERLGLGYEALSGINPRLVYGAIRGFGDLRSGGSPYLNWPSYDVVAQAMGGPIGLTGVDEDSPLKIGPGIGDIFSGLMLSFGIMSALRHAEKTGNGQFVDLAMYDAMISLCERAIYQYDYTNEIPKPSGNFHPFIAPFGIFPAKDGNIALAVVENHFWIELATLFNKNEFITMKNFSSSEERRNNINLVNSTVASWTKDYTKSELSSLLGGKVPFGPVNNVKEILDDPHVKTRRIIEEISHPDSLTSWRVAGNPLNFSSFEKTEFNSPPILGEHNSFYLKNKVLDDKINPNDLRKAFGTFATGVTVITTRQGDGIPRGFTANSFSSVSLDPPLLLICVSKKAKSLDVFLHSEHFCVNVLSEEQKSTASIFATQREDKFEVSKWKNDMNQMPIIEDSLAYFTCKTKNSFDAGDHIILLGEVEDFSSIVGSPLCYFRGEYISLGHEKSLANIASKTGLTSLGVILVNKNSEMILRRINSTYCLPRADNPKNGVDGLIEYLTRIGISCQIESLYSVYHDKPQQKYAIFYRGEASLISNKVDPEIDLEFISLDRIKGLKFSDEAEEIMVNRYIMEHKNNSFGLYEGDQDEGIVRNFKE